MPAASPPPVQDDFAEQIHRDYIWPPPEEVPLEDIPHEIPELLHLAL
jgi:hypothetical protein